MFKTKRFYHGIFCRGRKDDEHPIGHCHQCIKHGKMKIKRVRKSHILF